MTGQPAYFITVEGIEGVGKTVNIELIKEFLIKNSIDFIITREPGGTALAETIRSLLLDSQAEPIHETTELLLMFAARAQHIQQVIKPALAQNKWVLCDRFTDATYAYQGGGRGISQSDISILEQLVQKELRPDLTFILDLDPATGLARAKKRGELDRIEQEEIEFFEKVRAAYLTIAKKDRQRCKIIDAAQPLAAVQEEIAACLNSLL